MIFPVVACLFRFKKKRNMASVNGLNSTENELADEAQDWLLKQDLSSLDPTKLTPLTEEVDYFHHITHIQNNITGDKSSSNYKHWNNRTRGPWEVYPREGHFRRSYCEIQERT
jgi:hypothetical protein